MKGTPRVGIGEGSKFRGNNFTSSIILFYFFFFQVYKLSLFFFCIHIFPIAVVVFHGCAYLFGVKLLIHILRSITIVLMSWKK